MASAPCPGHTNNPTVRPQACQGVSCVISKLGFFSAVSVDCTEKVRKRAGGVGYVVGPRRGASVPSHLYLGKLFLLSLLRGFLFYIEIFIKMVQRYAFAPYPPQDGFSGPALFLYHFAQSYNGRRSVPSLSAVVLFALPYRGKWWPLSWPCGAWAGGAARLCVPQGPRNRGKSQDAFSQRGGRAVHRKEGEREREKRGGGEHGEERGGETARTRPRGGDSP